MARDWGNGARVMCSAAVVAAQGLIRSAISEPGIVIGAQEPCQFWFS